ncbi:Crp/Fnr family transcriptional regulator [Rhizosphaericola mali]|nr:Crp/Fnr family transcriptional regulator [Rhizosphaericola mali]
MKKHSSLVTMGEQVKYEYFVIKGCLRAYMTDPETGKEFTYQFAVENWWISDREAFLRNLPATITIDCLEPCELLGITLQNRQKLGVEIWKYEHYLNVKANFGYVALQKRLQIMISGNAKQRYEQFINQYPQLLNRVPKQFVASYLGVSRETISRLYRG